MLEAETAVARAAAVKASRAVAVKEAARAALLAVQGKQPEIGSEAAS